MRAVAAALIVLAAGACSDDAVCGPGAAPADGMIVSIGTEAVTYGGFTASANNDCTIAGSGVISVSVHGTQVDGGSALTLCLPRPDLLGPSSSQLAPSRVPPLATDRVQVIDASATFAGGCTATLDPTLTPIGEATFAGYCADGADPAGYAMTINGQLPLRVTCPAGTTAMTATITGTVAVAVQ
ncbi:MAG: hypothetical protein IPL61_13810 [Myxococcales bacterium]|nr:hypothetical protein [Myxococcales bacterium]